MRSGASAFVWLLLVVVAAAVVLLVMRRAARREVELRGAGSPPAGSRGSDGGAGGTDTRRRPPGLGSPGRQSAATGTADASVLGQFDGCPVTGDGGDRELNRLKNRSYEGAYVALPLAEVLSMSWPTGVDGRYRARWSGRARALVAPQESRAVSVEGYLVRARASGPESTNCHGDAARYRDYHLWLTAAPGEGRERSMIAEMTPRLRVEHANWNLEVLNRVVQSGERVRASGWLLLDQEHPDQIGRTRGTVWEIHPVTRFEVQRDGRWISLDDVSFARRARGRR